MPKKPKLIPLPNRTPTLLLSPTRAFISVTSKSGKGVYASSDTLFKGAIFGRDSLEVAEDVLAFRPKLVKNILCTLASLQGLHSSDFNEEEHGKIVHEYRSLEVDGRPVDDVSKLIFRKLSAVWGGDLKTMAYYGSVDATPLYVRVLCNYADKYSKNVLKTRIQQKDGQPVSLLASMTMAVDWIMDKLANSSSGLLEYHRRNPHGIENQVWKDSREFYVHTNGELANIEQPIASIEVQGLAYDALVLSSQFLPERKRELLQRANQLRDRTVELLWRPQQKYFALGCDHAKDGHLRIIETLAANAAELLDTGFFDELPKQQKQLYITGLASKIMSTDFLTDAGIRSRALSESQLIPFWDYHGSFTTWPKETYDIAKGLRRQGFPLLAKELENRLINLVRKSHSYPEFVYVDEKGRVLTTSPGAHVHGELTLVDSTNKPENIQAWTVSAVLSIMAYRLPGKRPPQPKQETWQSDLEKNILVSLPRVSRLWRSKQLKARYPDYPYRLTKKKNLADTV